MTIIKPELKFNICNPRTKVWWLQPIVVYDKPCKTCGVKSIFNDWKLTKVELVSVTYNALGQVFYKFFDCDNGKLDTCKEDKLFATKAEALKQVKVKREENQRKAHC